MQLMYHGEDFALVICSQSLARITTRRNKRCRLSFWQILVSYPPDCVRAAIGAFGLHLKSSQATGRGLSSVEQH